VPLQVPPDLEQGLADAPTARRRFDSLPPQEKDRWIAWVQRARLGPARRRRIAHAQAALGVPPRRAASGEEFYEEIPPPRPLIWPWLLLLLLLVAGGLIALWLLTRGGDNHKARPVVVPNVVGQKQNSAVAEVNSRHLVARIATKTSKLPAGTVFAEDPSAGAHVTRGSTVTLSVSSAAQVVVPDVVGMKAARAVAVLRAEGLDVQTASITSRKRNGLVVSQSPAAGASVAKGSTEVIRVSRGLVRVPNVVGQDRATAVAAIRGAKLVPSTVRVPSTQPKGTVVAQAPRGGTRVAQGSKVRLNISRGSPPAGGPPPPPPAQGRAVPKLVGLNQAEAQRRLNAAGFKAQVLYGDSDRPEQTVTAQSPDPGTRVPAGTRVKLVASRGPNPATQEQVPRVVGLTPAQATARLQDVGFEVQRLTQKVSTSRQDGVVVDVQPAGGSAAPAGSTVTIYVGRLSTTS
jgi:serine/threonine-protein kinase